MGGDRLQLAARDAPREGLVVAGDRVRHAYDVVVVGSGAGGGVIAGELAQRGRDVLLARVRTAPPRARLHALRGEGGARPLLAAALRAARRAASSSPSSPPLRRRHDDDQHEGRLPRARARRREVASGERADERRERPRSPSPTSTRTTTTSSACSASASAPTGRRACTRSSRASVRSGAELEAVNAYTDPNCTSCGSCIQGCPSNAGKSTMNTYIADALARGILELRAERTVERVVVEGGEATGVEFVDATGERQTVRAGAVVVAAGRAQHAAAPAPLRPREPRRSGGTSASTPCASCTGSSTSRRTRTWSTRSPRTA